MSKRLTVGSVAAVASAIVVAGLGVPAGASTTPRAKLTPPVIHESFTPLPCTGAPKQRTTLEMQGCSEQQILATDKSIDTLSAKIFAVFNNQTARRDFIAGHNAWLSYRRTYCTSVSDVFQGGTLTAVIAADCFATVNRQHLKNLKVFYLDLTSG